MSDHHETEEAPVGGPVVFALICVAIVVMTVWLWVAQ